jgi:hypothetical protein
MVSLRALSQSKGGANRAGPQVRTAKRFSGREITERPGSLRRVRRGEMCAIIEQVAERFQPTSAKFAHDVAHPREAPRLSSAEAGPPHSPLSHLLPSGVNHLTRHTEATIQSATAGWGAPRN